MQKFLGIIVLGLCLVCNNSFAKEIILNCYKLDPEGSQKVAVAVAVAKITGAKIDSEIDIFKNLFRFLIIGFSGITRHQTRSF